MKVSISATPKNATRIIILPKSTYKNIPDFKGEENEIAVRYEGKETLIYAGCGTETSDHLRSAAGQGIREAARLKRTAVSIIPTKNADTDPALIRAIAEGATLATYVFDRYRSEKSTPVSSIELVTQNFPLIEFKNVATVSENVNFARDLINANASDVYPAVLAAEAKSIAKKYTAIKTTVLTDSELAAQGFGLITAVGQGSPYPARLIAIEYTGAPKEKRKTALVGKGVTFDSGGQNLKPSGSIENMREDMSGAAAVMATIRAAAELSLPVNIVAVIPSVHNAIGSNSYFPGDIYKSYNGTTVEILNTDAEGRLILADALAWCIEKFKPSEVIDIATLTGAIVTALGGTIGGVFSNNDELAAGLEKCGTRTGEHLWRMPIRDEHRESMKSDIADMRNMSKMKKGSASSLVAAAFLEAFVKETPWAHLDIAGVAWNEGEASGENPKYGVGFGVRLLLEYVGRSGKGLQ